MTFDETDPLLPLIVWALTQGVGWLQQKTKLPKWTREVLPFVAIFIAFLLRWTITAAEGGELTWLVVWRGIINGISAVFLHVSTRPLRNTITAPPEE